MVDAATMDDIIEELQGLIDELIEEGWGNPELDYEHHATTGSSET